MAQAVRDLKPLPRPDAHKAAITAMARLNGTLDQKLRHGEAVHRPARTAKLRVPRRAPVVVRDAGRADPKGSESLLKAARRAKAKTLFVDREHSRSALLQAAKTMRPGERRTVRPPR